jgi:hypothetical protein
MADDDEFEEVFSSTICEESESSIDRESKMKTASELKEKGNEQFRLKNYEDASQFYSRLIYEY